jgi:hypothetical protein
LQCLTVRIGFGLNHFDITQTCSTEPVWFFARITLISTGQRAPRRPCTHEGGNRDEIQL